MKLALNDAFIALITLWAEAVGFMRLHPYRGRSDFPFFVYYCLLVAEFDAENINSRFEKAIKKVDDSFSYLEVCAAVKGSGIERGATSNETENLPEFCTDVDE